MKFHLLISGGKEELGLLADVRNATERIEENEGIEHSVFYTGVQFRALSRFQQILLHEHGFVTCLEHHVTERAGRTETGDNP